MNLIPGTGSYFLPGNKNGVVLVHGYTGTPLELRPLGDYLHKLGFTVLGIRLPGHGTDWHDLETKTWPDWYQAVAEGVSKLKGDCSWVAVVGLSLGGLLTIKAAAELPIHAAVLLSTPIEVKDWRAPFVGFLRYFIRTLRRRKYIGSELRQRYDRSYEYMPTKPLTSLFALRNLCAREYLPLVQVPVLIIQSKAEHTVNPSSARYIYEHLGSKVKQLLWLTHSGHVITLDEESPLVCTTAGNFLERCVENETGK